MQKKFGTTDLICGGHDVKEYSKNNAAAILNFLKESPSFQFSAAQIHEALHKAGSNINLTTVYRQLDKMVASSSVLQFVAEDGSTKLYQINRCDCESHLHVRCAVCGTIVHLDCAEVAGFLQHINSEHRIKINCSNSILLGICDKCRNKR